jgi:hypothetical protein
MTASRPNKIRPLAQSFAIEVPDDKRTVVEVA